MAVNKVNYAGETLIDLTGDTVVEEKLAAGVTAHNAAGEVIMGTMPASTSAKEILTFTCSISPSTTTHGTLSNLSHSFLELQEAFAEGRIIQGIVDISALYEGQKLVIFSHSNKDSFISFSSSADIGDSVVFLRAFVYESSTAYQLYPLVREERVIDYDETEHIDYSKEYQNSLPTLKLVNKVAESKTTKLPRPFEITATIDFANQTLSDVKIGNNKASEGADIFSLISQAYDNDYHIYIQGDLSAKYQGQTSFLQLTVFGTSAAVFEQVININNSYYHMRATIFSSNSFSFSEAELVSNFQVGQELTRIEDIANGKCKSYVKSFRDRTDPNCLISTPASEVLNEWIETVDKSQFNIGDVFLVKDVGVPDYWWDGVGLSILETTKVDLSSYAKKSEIPTSLPANGGNSDTIDGYHIVVAASAPTDATSSTITFVV